MIAPREVKKRPDGGRSVRPNGPGKGLCDRFEDAGREQRLGWRGRAERAALVAGEGKAAPRNRLLPETVLRTRTGALIRCWQSWRRGVKGLTSRRFWMPRF